MDDIEPRVFVPAGAILLVFVLFAVITPDVASSWITGIQTSIVAGFGWYYVLLVSALVVFALWVGIGHFGDIKLGKDDEKPEFGLLSWMAMLFAAGMGIGLVFYGVAEPLNHFANPKPGFEGSDVEAAQQGMVQTFLHWGLHPWAIYVAVGLAVAYAVHRKGRPVSIRWALEPLLGNRIHGWLGDAIDVTAVVGTLFGVATSLGFGVTQVVAGLNATGATTVEAAEPSMLHVVLIGGITLIATISVVTGVDKGIKWLSNFNMSLAGLLMLFVLFTGPTLFLLREYVQSIGAYVQSLIVESFDVSALQVVNDAGLAWQGSWTIFYWGWWISWAPFVGVFIARISRGRTVREFVTGVLVVPTMIGFLWFAVFGGTGIYRQLFGQGGLIGEDGAVATEGSLFAVLESLPLGTLLGWVTIILVVIFFVTSSDSGSFVVDMLSSGGNPQPAKWSRVFWAVLEGLIAAVLLLAGGLGALQQMAIVIALPFSVVMVAMCVATWKQFHAERQAWLRVQRRRQAEELTDEVSRALIQDGLIEEPDKEKAPTSS